MEKTSSMLRGGFIPQPDDIEKKREHPELYLNMEKPFGHIMGVDLAPARFEQDDKFFDHQGKLIEKKPLGLEAEQDEK